MYEIYTFIHAIYKILRAFWISETGYYKWAIHPEPTKWLLDIKIQINMNTYFLLARSKEVVVIPTLLKLQV
jgi:hypothetical protein